MTLHYEFVQIVVMFVGHFIGDEWIKWQMKISRALTGKPSANVVVVVATKNMTIGAKFFTPKLHASISIRPPDCVAYMSADWRCTLIARN